MKVNVARIDSSAEGFAEIARIHQGVSEVAAGDVYVDFSNVSWLEANMCAPLAAAFAGDNRSVKLQNVRPDIQTILAKNGFVRGLLAVDTYGTTMPLQHFDPSGSAGFEAYVEDNFRGKGLPAMSIGLQREFRRSIFELFENAVAHSETMLGIFACGQFFPNRRQLHFCVTDPGIGIPQSVRSYLGRGMDARDAIDWAMSGKNTTRRRADRVPGGLGLKIIRDFIARNGGAIRVASDDGFWWARGDHIGRSRLPSRFPGTAVDIEINTADTKMYHLTGEIDPREIF